MFLKIRRHFPRIIQVHGIVINTALHTIMYLVEVNTIRHIPLNAFKFSTRKTEGGIVDDPSVSASWKVMINWKLRRHKTSNF